MSKIVKSIDTSFNVLLYNSKYPAWDLFNHVPFDIILLETQKNYDQMTSIITTSTKTHEYININGIFVRKGFLEDKEDSKEDSDKDSSEKSSEILNK